MMSCCGSTKTISFSWRSRTIQGITPTSSNRAARPTPRISRPGTRTRGSARSIRSARPSPRRSEPRQAQRLPPSSERMSSANRQGGPSSQRIVGGSSSPSVRRSRSRPVRASRSTSAAWFWRSTNRRVPIAVDRAGRAADGRAPLRRRRRGRRARALRAGPGVAGPRGRTSPAATPARATRASAGPSRRRACAGGGPGR